MSEERGAGGKHYRDLQPQRTPQELASVLAELADKTKDPPMHRRRARPLSWPGPPPEQAAEPATPPEAPAPPAPSARSASPEAETQQLRPDPETERLRPDPETERLRPEPETERPRPEPERPAPASPTAASPAAATPGQPAATPGRPAATPGPPATPSTPAGSSAPPPAPPAPPARAGGLVIGDRLAPGDGNERETGGVARPRPAGPSERDPSQPRIGRRGQGGTAAAPSRSRVRARPVKVPRPPRRSTSSGRLTRRGWIVLAAVTAVVVLIAVSALKGGGSHPQPTVSTAGATPLSPTTSTPLTSTAPAAPASGTATTPVRHHRAVRHHAAAKARRHHTAKPARVRHRRHHRRRHHKH